MRPRIAASAVVLALASVGLAVAAPASSERAHELEPCRFEEAWKRASGAGVTVAVVASEGSPVLAVVARAAPGARVLACHEPPRKTSSRAKAARPREPRTPARARGSGADPAELASDRALARALDAALESGARVVLVPLARRRALGASTAAIARLVSAGAVVVAPAGDEGLGHERFPAALAGVVAVAALGPGGHGPRALAPAANAGARTCVAAPEVAEVPGSTGASALVAGALALAVQHAPGVGARELVAALGAGPPVAARGPDDRLPRPAILDAAGLLERTEAGARAFVLREAWVLPRYVPQGEKARVHVRVESVGALPAHGTVLVEVPGSAVLSLPFGPLAPGESVELGGDVVPRATEKSEALALPDGGVVRACPREARFHAGSEEAQARFFALPGDERPPGVELLSVAAEPGLRVAVTVGNAGSSAETDALVRLRASSGVVLAEIPVPDLAVGEAARFVVAGRRPADATGPLEVTLELVRAPAGFRETVEASALLRLDPLGAPAARKKRAPRASREAAREHASRGGRGARGFPCILGPAGAGLSRSS